MELVKPDWGVEGFVQRRWKAPELHGHSLQSPALLAAGQFISHNQSELASQAWELAGESVGKLRDELRAKLVSEAAEYTRQYRDVDSSSWKDETVVLSGHQPRLFHAGVWFKNYALSYLGQSFGCTPINLIVDNDLCGLPAVVVPVLRNGRYTIQACHYDGIGDNVPFEVRPIVAFDVFSSFADRLSHSIGNIVAAPLVENLWPHCLALARTGRPLGQVIAGGRHKLESELGWQTLELPLSKVCQTRVFNVFVADLLTRADEFRRIYNQCLVGFRRTNHVRSQSHPVPQLNQQNDWNETALWVYSANDKQRRPLFCRQTRTQVELSDRAGWQTNLSHNKLAEQLIHIQSSGVRIRVRALTTTLFCRLFGCDLFVHGIGGAKYDELTNEISRNFFGVEPPGFMTLTATFRLPGHEDPVSKRDLTAISRSLREVKYHPEKFLKHSDFHRGESSAELKQNLLKRRTTAPDLKKWTAEMRNINAQMVASLTNRISRFARDLTDLQAAFEQDSIIASREFPFCCFDQRLTHQLPAAVDKLE